MPRIRLSVRNDGPNPSPGRQYLDPTHPRTVHVIPALRLMSRVGLEPNPKSWHTAVPRSVTALIDTGAWISVIERDAWEEYEHAGLLVRLEHPTEGLTLTPTATGHIVGHKTPYVFGKLWITVHDADKPPRPSLPCVPVIAQLLLKRRAKLPYPIILGLHLGVLDGRRLIRDPVMGYTHPIVQTDCGARYGQEWYLETV